MADRQGHRRTFDPLAAALVVAASACASGGPAAGPPESQAVVAPAPEPAPVAAAAPVKPAPRPRPRPHLRWADSTVLERAVTTRLGYEPLARVLGRRTRRPELAGQWRSCVRGGGST
jgi:DNA polymerase-3 subunit gamma/tau